jgi:hypothetical protein
MRIEQTIRTLTHWVLLSLVDTLVNIYHPYERELYESMSTCHEVLCSIDIFAFALMQRAY